MKFIALLMLLLAAYLSIRYAVPLLGSKVVAGITEKNGESVLVDCPGTPNCQCSEASRQSQRVDRIPVTKNPSQSIAVLARIIEGIKGMEVQLFDEKYLYATATTSLMKYVDDIEFLLSDDGQSIQVRSASRIGKADLGANARRIEIIRTAALGEL